LTKSCHCKYSEKIYILSRVKSSHSASQCKQVGVSRKQTREFRCDWPSCCLQPVGPLRRLPFGWPSYFLAQAKLVSKNSNTWSGRLPLASLLDTPSSLFVQFYHETLIDA